MKKDKNILYATVGEGALILTLAAIGWAAHMPLIFPSLGPTAYEQVEKPNTPSAKLYNVVVGHFLALGAGFLSLWILHAWNAPVVATAGFVSPARLEAATLAVVITVISTLALKANQPASLATALLVSLGSMQKGRDAVAMVIAILILAAIGEPVRRVFAKAGVGQ
ncbi:MAG TPA: HPP family protein [Terriglobales bacterium]|nr:HPP family protein [Terriglobales bacterium]